MLFVLAMIIISVMVHWAFNINYLSVMFVFSLIILSVMVDWAFKTNYLLILVAFALPSCLTGCLKSIICLRCLSSP